MKGGVKMGVFSLLKEIPDKKVTTYKQLAEAVGSHPRAVGKVLNSNPDLKKYPCYKVIKSDGSLGGYRLGKKKKRKLLERDGIEIRRGKVNLDKHLFTFSGDG